MNSELPAPEINAKVESPVSNINPRAEKKFYTKWWFWLIVAITLVIIFSPREKGDSNSASTTDSTSIPESPTTNVSSSNGVLVAYVGDITPIIETVSGSLGSISELFGDPQIGDESWNLQVAIALTAMKSEYQSALLIDPPSCMNEVHRLFIGALGDFNHVAENLPTAVDNLDTTEISRLTGVLGDATDKLNTASAMIPTVDVASC